MQSIFETVEGGPQTVLSETTQLFISRWVVGMRCIGIAFGKDIFAPGTVTAFDVTTPAAALDLILRTCPDQTDDRFLEITTNREQAETYLAGLMGTG